MNIAPDPEVKAVAVETVCPSVYQIGGPGISSPEDCCVYLAEDGGELAVIDAGLGLSVPVLLENIRSLGFEFRAGSQIF